MYAKPRLKDKIVVILCIACFSITYSGISLCKPEILTAIVQHEHPSYKSDAVAAKASFYKSFLDGATCVVTLFMLPILGSLSDVFGRKKLMILGYSALGITAVIYEFSYKFNMLGAMYISCIFSFQMISQICTIAYMTDIAEDEKDKTKNFGLILAAFMGGMIVGSPGFGYIGKYGISLSLYIIFGISIGLMCVIMFVFEENTQFYHERHSRKFDWRKGNPFSAMQLVLGTNTFVSMVSIVYTINFLAISDSTTIFLYTESRYNWGTFENGLIGAVAGVSSMLWQGLGVGLMLKAMSRLGILTSTMFLAVVVHALQGFAPYGWLFMAGVALTGYVAIGFPLMQSLISEQIPSEKQGMAFGGLSSLTSVASLVGELITENVLSVCLDKHFITCPGTAFYICAFLFLVDACICFVLYIKYPQKNPKNEGYVSINASEDVPNNA